MRSTLLALATFALAACTHAPKKVETVETKPAPVEVAKAPAPEPEVNTCASDSACKDGFLCLHGSCVAITADLAECQMTRVHFEFNEALIRTEDQESLQRMARCLKAASKMHVTIEGNADERGTEEYNMHLGGKRAAAVEEYLSTLGASRAQLDTVSYGYERPLCTEKNEACWAKNRRAALKPDVAKAP